MLSRGISLLRIEPKGISYLLEGPCNSNLKIRVGNTARTQYIYICICIKPERVDCFPAVHCNLTSQLYYLTKVHHPCSNYFTCIINMRPQRAQPFNVFSLCVLIQSRTQDFSQGGGQVLSRSANIVLQSL